MISKLIVAAVVALAASPGADLDATLQKVAAYEYGQSRAAIIELQNIVADAINSPEKASALEKRFDEFLASGATLAGKDAVIRHVSLIGTEASVPVLTEMLVVPETSEMARYALERNRSGAAGEALRSALAKTSGKVRIGVINTLGVRRDTAAIPALGKLAVDTDAGARTAALSALARVGTVPAADALLQAIQGSALLTPDMLMTLIECADRMDDSARAVAIYKQLLQAGADEMVDIAALRSLARRQGREAPPELEKAIGSGSSKMKAAAISALNDVPGPEVTEAFVRMLPKLKPVQKVQVVTALGTRGDAAAAAAVLGLGKDEDEGVRAAALVALGRLGNASMVPLLAGTAASGSEAEKAAARESLYALRGRAVDDAVLERLQRASGPERIELIRASGERGITGASDVLIGFAKDRDTAVRTEALKALRETAGAAQVPALLALLASASTPAERLEGERTLSTALRRSDNSRIADVVTAYKKAKRAAQRASLLLVLGQAGEKSGLPALRAALNQTDSEVRRAAILGLTEWPSAEPLNDLLGIAKDGRNPAQQVLGLRGYIKLVSLPSERTPAESVALLETALKLATQAEEKKAVLALLPKYASPEAQKMAEASLGDDTVAKEAKAAADRIRRLLADN